MAKPKLLQLKTWPVWAGPLLAICCMWAGAVGLAYFWRVMFDLASLPLLPLAFGIGCVGTLVCLLLVLAFRWAKDKISAKAALVVFIAGLLFVFASAPLQAPDEETHYLRAYSISMGRFNYDYDRGYPEDVNWLLKSTETSNGLGFAIQNQNHELAPSQIAEYKAGVASDGAAEYTVREPIMLMLLPFLPQGLCMAVARLFGFSALGLLYAGRIGNLLCYAALCYATFKNCARYRGVFIAVALLPLSLFMGASCNYDGLMLPLCFYMVSFFCRDEVREKHLVGFLLAATLVTYIKPNNLLLVAILLLVPKTRWKAKWNPWLVVGVTVAVALLFRQGMEWLDGSVLANNYPSSLPRGVTGNADPKAQLLFVLAHPFAMLSRMAFSLYEEAGYLFSTGVLGKLDMSLPLVSGLSVLSLSAASALGIQQKEDTRRGPTLALALAVLGYTAAVQLGIYVTDSDFASIRITGLQPRYFLPAFLLLFMLCSILLGKAVRPKLQPANGARVETITLYIALAVALLAALFLFQSYFIGQWMAKGDGGFKMMNVLGGGVYGEAVYDVLP